MLRAVSIALLFFVMPGLPHVHAASMADQIKAVLSEIRSRGSLKFSPATDKLAIEASSRELKRFSKISVAASMSEAGANLVIAQQLDTDRRFKSPRFSFANQVADGTMQFSGPLSIPVLGEIHVDADLGVRMATSVEINPTEDSADFLIRFSVTKLDVMNLKLSRRGKPVSGMLTGVAEAVIDGILRPAQTLLNHLELRLPTTITARIELKAPQKQGVNTTFEPKTLEPKLKVTAFSHIIDDGRIIAIMQEGGTLADVGASRITDDMNAFGRDFYRRLSSDGVTWMKQGQLSVYVERDFISRITSQIMTSGSICMSTKANDLPLPFGKKVKLPATEIIDCSPTRDCTPTRKCEQNEECAQKEECRRCVKIFGGKTCLNDFGCELGKSQRKASCELGKTTRKAQCEAEKSAEKARCEAAKKGEKVACETFKGAYDLIRRAGKEYANVDSKDLLINGDARICINELTFDAKKLRLTGKAQIVATARASGQVQFTPLNVAGHATCFAPVKKPLALTATVPQQSVDVDAEASIVNDSSEAGVRARVTSPLRIRLPVGTLATKLAADPAFTISCPIPGSAARARAVTPDAWWPGQASGDIEVRLPGFNLNIDLVRRPPTISDLQISGSLKSTPTGVGGIFQLAPKPKRVNRSN